MFQANRESCKVMSHDHFHRHHAGSTQLFSSPPPPSSAFNGSDGGALSCNRNNRLACFGDKCNVAGAADTDAVAPGSKLASFNLDLSGEMRSSSMNARVPPTASQWRELERQTIIYKYIVASEPVPPELLVPITKTQSNTSLSQPHELGISSCSNLDPEPWRCKRTDGKKWRCSRDVAPHQKYCERHSHKSRSRSRKPVELHTDSMANAITNSHSLTRKSHLPTSHFSVFPNVMVSTPNSFDHPGNLEWFLRAAVPSNSNQEWHHLKSERIEGGSEILYHHREGQLDSNLYMNSRVSSHPLQTHRRLNDNCSMLLSPKSTSLDPAGQPQAQETRLSLDFWSSAMRESNTSDAIGSDHCSVSSSDKMLPLSTLTLSMSGGSDNNVENANGQASCSFGIMGSDKMNHGPWMSSPPGGPLAEALCLGISNSTRADSKLASSHGDSCGTNSNS